MPILVFGFALVALWLHSNAAKGSSLSCGSCLRGCGLPDQSYGFAINNPGNIRWIANAQQRWQGMVSNKNGYAVFDTLANGVRAIGKQLNVDYNRGATTVAALITLWAPAADDNNTRAYIADVAGRLGVDPTTPLAWPDSMYDMTAAIIIHETGANPISESDLLTYLNS